MNDHGNKNNKNSQKGDQPAAAFLHLRCTMAQKNSYVKKAQKAGQKLTEWILEKLDKKS